MKHSCISGKNMIMIYLLNTNLILTLSTYTFIIKLLHLYKNAMVIVVIS